MNRYEVVIFNQSVRQAYAEGKKHPNFGEEWSDIRHFEVEAETEDDARDSMRKRYPERHGFEILDVVLMKQFID